jgi:hypothetical protein
LVRILSDRNSSEGPRRPEDVPVTKAEIEVFEAWFGDLFDEFFSTRH